MAYSGSSTLRLGDVCDKIGSGATPRGGKEVYLAHGPYALIRSQNVHNDGFRHEGLAHIDSQCATQLDHVEVKIGDVLLNITGDSVARACQVDPAVLPARVNQHVAIIRPEPNKLHPRYLRYWLVTPTMQAQLLSWASAGGTRNALTKGMIADIEVLLPPLPEQKRIAHILGTLDDKIELNRRMCRTLEEMARAIFKSWFVDFDPVRAKAEGRQPHGMDAATAALFPDSFQESELGLIPKGWEVKRLTEVVEVNPVRALGTADEVPYVEMQNIPTAGHGVLGARLRPPGSGSRFCNGDTLLARITPCLENGKTAFVDFLDDGQSAWGSTEFIVLRPKPPHSPEFGYLLARDDSFREFAIQSMTGSSGRQRVPTTALAHYRLASAPAGAAMAFGALVTPLFRRMRTASVENTALTQQRDALLPRLLSGDLAT